MADTGDTKALEVLPLVERLRERAEKVRGYIANNDRVLELMKPEMDRFEAREGHNIYATRLAVDHLSSNRSYAKELADWTDAADTIEAQDTNLARMREALREMKFQLLWRADGMAVEQARIHADAWANEVFARQALAERGRG